MEIGILKRELADKVERVEELLQEINTLKESNSQILKGLKALSEVTDEGFIIDLIHEGVSQQEWERRILKANLESKYLLERYEKQS